MFNVIIWLMLSFYISHKVITLSGFHCDKHFLGKKISLLFNSVFFLKSCFATWFTGKIIKKIFIGWKPGLKEEGAKQEINISVNGKKVF